MGAEKDKETKRQGENGRGVSQNEGCAKDPKEAHNILR